MRVMRRLRPAACASVLALAACAAPAKVPLQPGYYFDEYPQAGIARRIVIAAGDRRASYDLWRVSPSDDGIALHAHYDLIASDDVPTSGTFAVTQDGSDCGTLSIQPYAPPRSNVLAIEVRRGLLGVEHFVRESPASDPNSTKVSDAQMSREIAQIAAGRPQLYRHLPFFYKFVYGELTPQCQFD
jgi:hypothetical protein